MNAKKYEMTLNYGQGEETETRYFNGELSCDEIEKILLETEYDFGPIPVLDYIGIVDIESTLGKDYETNGDEYISKEDLARRMMEEFSSMCPNDH